eukprot:TRINITY_DN26643_c1_g1_i4.p1 TRINITY_DN26643_c1_g1~~TRINITY_DN26643_c1_g1_i4.p1  ORF type:complete len:197 (+),score=-15.97 TRINITY_DN26643_c1_g1_i4:296-886(+)
MRSWYQLFNLFLQQYKSTIHLYKFAKTQINLVEILLKTFRFFFFHNTMQPQLTKKSNHCSTLNKIIKQSIQIVQYTSTYQYISHIQPFFFNWINTVFFIFLLAFLPFQITTTVVSLHFSLTSQLNLFMQSSFLALFQSLKCTFQKYKQIEVQVDLKLNVRKTQFLYTIINILLTIISVGYANYLAFFWNFLPPNKQ